ncbi:MAG: hypothetical protein ACJAXU_000774 [Paracoccaceae bacterium]|jgi:hypothetical protein
MKLILSVFLSLWTMTAMAFAADFGIKFGEMKRGTKIYYENSSGMQFVKTLKGKRRGGYMLDVKMLKGSTSKGWKEFYTKAGHLKTVEIRSMGSRGVTTYTPFHCGKVIGKCAMTSDSGDPISVGGGKGLKLLTKYAYNVKASGDGYSVYHTEKKLGFKAGTIKMEVQTTKQTAKVKLAIYNLTALKTWKAAGKSHWIKLIKIK